MEATLQGVRIQKLSLQMHEERLSTLFTMTSAAAHGVLRAS